MPSLPFYFQSWRTSLTWITGVQQTGFFPYYTMTGTPVLEIRRNTKIYLFLSIIFNLKVREIKKIVKKLAIIMEPFIPFTTERIWDLLNLKGSVHSQLWNEINNDFPLNHKINKAKPLFKKIIESEEELQTKLENFRNTIKTE